MARPDRDGDATMRRLASASLVVLIAAAAAAGAATRSAVKPAQPAPSAPKKPAVERSFPSVSPDGSRIVYLSNETGDTDVYVMPAAGGKGVRLTRDDEEEDDPTWSADGQHLVFGDADREGSHLFSMAPDGSDRRQISTVPGRTPRLSPDGTRVAYSRGPWTQVAVYVAPLAGGATIQLTDGSGVAWNCEWSPDGHALAFTGRDARGNLQIFVVDADGKTPPRQLTHFASADGNAQVPAWSSDGRRIAFAASTGTHDSELWIADATTGEAHRAGARQHGHRDEVPRWFPDGKRLAFQSDRSGRMEIWVLDLVSGQARQLTR